MRARLAVLAAVLRHPRLLRLEAAFLIFAFGEWATWVAVIVYAYGRGGPAEAGIVAFIELAPSVLGAPAIAALGDRGSRARVLFGTYAGQAVLMAATATALVTSAPSVLVYVLATATATAVALSRPVNASLLPEVVAAPDDLTAANVVAGMAEAAGSLLGPLGAGVLIAFGGPAAVFVVATIGNVVAAAAVAGIARQVDGPGDPAELAWPVSAASQVTAASGGRDGTDTPSGTRAPPRHELLGGVAAIWADRRLRSVVTIAAWATFLVGALDILFAVLAIDILGLGASGVGFLGALTGAGAIAGSAAGLLLVGRERLGIVLALAGCLFGLGLAAISISSGSLAAGILLVCAGCGSGLTAVVAQTNIQRLAGDDVMSRVFGVLQGLMMGSTALGALAVPVLVTLVGDRAAFALAGLSLPVAILLLGRAALETDENDADRAHSIRLLRGVPMLAPLSAPILERLAGTLIPFTFPAGTVVIEAGDEGDRFYVVVGGRLAVELGGQPVRTLGPGDAFGEIALVRDIRRTATVRALDDVTLIALDREPFLEALGGQPRSRSIAVGLTRQRLAEDEAKPTRLADDAAER